MEFSQSFLSKYSDPVKHASMQEVVNGSFAYVDSINASQADKELMFEALYAFKHTIAERAGIDMEEIYKKVGLVDSIGDAIYEKGSKAAAMCEFSGMPKDKPISITADVQYANDENDYRKAILIHEYCHAFSAGYQMDAYTGKYQITSTGLRGTGIDEAVNDMCAAEMTSFLGYHLNYHSPQVETRAGDFGQFAYTTTDASGYVRIAEYAKLMEAVYGPEILYGDKFMHTASIANSYGEDHYKFIADTLDKLQEKSNSINGHLSIEGSFLSTFERRWENDNNYNFSNYINDCQAIHSAATTLWLAGSNGDTFKVDTMSARQSYFEIGQIYAQIKGIDSPEKLAAELNPATRSQDCYDFLIAMDGLKHLDKTYSNDELWDMQYKRINLGKNSALELKIGGDIYHIAGSVEKSTGLTSYESIIEASDQSWGRARFDELLKTYWFNKDDGANISFTRMAEVDNYSKIYENLYQLSKNYDTPFKESDIITFAAAMSQTIQRREVVDLVVAVDVENIKDANGNNLFHILAKNDSYNAAQMVQVIHDLQPEVATRLMNTPNNEGKTPMDMIHTYGNYSLLCETYNSRILDYSTSKINGNNYDSVRGEFVSVESKIIGTGNAGFINRLVTVGMDANARDINGNTLLHHYAAGAIENLDIQLLMNRGASMTVLNKEGDSPIQIAVSNLNVEQTGTLLKFGANPNVVCDFLLDMKVAQGFGENAFEHAQREQILDKLLAAGANPNLSNGITLHATPLQIAAGINNQELTTDNVDYVTVYKLLRAGADPFTDTKAGMSLRDFAAETGDVALFRTMIEAGIDPEALNIQDSKLSAIDRAILSRIDRTVDMDLMGKIEAHRIAELANRTLDMDVIIQDNSEKEFVVAGDLKNDENIEKDDLSKDSGFEID